MLIRIHFYNHSHPVLELTEEDDASFVSLCAPIVHESPHGQLYAKPPSASPRFAPSGVRYGKKKTRSAQSKQAASFRIPFPSRTREWKGWLAAEIDVANVWAKVER